MVRTTKDYVQNQTVSEGVLDFLSEIMSSKEAKNSEEYSGARTFTSEIIRPTDDEEKRVLAEAGLDPVEEWLTFNRTVRDKIVYCSSAYTKLVVYDDTCVRLVDGNYGVMKKIFKTSANGVLDEKN